jgi:hypothetical protein
MKAKAMIVSELSVATDAGKKVMGAITTQERMVAPVS